MNRVSDALGPSARQSAGRALSALGDTRARPNIRWISALTGASFPEIGRILEETEDLVPMEEEIRQHHRLGGRTYYAQFRAPFDIYALVRLLRPAHIIETGVSSGVSSAHFLAALRRNGSGTLHSIDLPVAQRGERFGARDSPVALPPGHESGWAVPDSLRDGWDLRIGPSESLLPRLVKEIGSLGIFLHDSLHTPSHLTFELTTVRSRLTPGAAVLADNTQWTGAAFPRFCASLGVPLARRGRTDLVGLRFPPPAPYGDPHAL